MSEFKGIVQQHLIRPWNNKTFYSFTLSGVDGIFGMGTKRPPAEGASIAFKATANAKGFLDVAANTIQFLADGEPATAAIPTKESPGTGNGQEAPQKAPKALQQAGYWEERAKRDLVNDAARELGASRNTALTFIELALKHEAVPLPKTAAKREEYLWGLLDKYTQKLMGRAQPDAAAAAQATADPTDVTKTDEDWK
jgi:hypothetical protein